MPSIDVAMARSVRHGALDLLTAAIRPAVEKRDVISSVAGQVGDVKTAFSSWDNCMQASICKYPVIAIIVVGGLMIISVIWCIARCACCGLSCCCECFYCLKCCGNCCGCCDPPNKRSKYLDEPYIPPDQGYRSNAPMTTGAAVPGGTFKPAVHEPPQYAEFEVSKKGGGHEDALPEMPSWEGAGSKKVALDQDEAVEMENLKKPEAVGQNVPLMAGGMTSPGTPDGRNPYGHQGAHAVSAPYLAQGIGVASPYGMNDQGYNNNARAYGQSSASLGVDPAYGMAGGAMGAGRRSPRDQHGGGYETPNQAYSRSRQGSYDDYRRNGTGGSQEMVGYGMDRRAPRIPDVMDNTGAYGDQYGDQYGNQPPRRSPVPPADHGYRGGGYDADPYGPPSRQYSSDSQRPFARSQPQQQQYPRAPASPLQDSGGFDFNSGYSRPPTQGRDEYNYSRPGTGNQGGGGGGAYPGYKAYQPDNGGAQQGWSGL